jgi:hypothetical protein
MSYIGVKSRIADGINLPSGTSLPDGAVISTQEQAGEILSSETAVLQAEFKRLRGKAGLRTQKLSKAASE